MPDGSIWQAIAKRQDETIAELRAEIWRLTTLADQLAAYRAEIDGVDGPWVAL